MLATQSAVSLLRNLAMSADVVSYKPKNGVFDGNDRHTNPELRILLFAGKLMLEQYRVNSRKDVEYPGLRAY